MSRHLPPQPNLEHLRKQAKDLLHDLQRRDPALQLADAQRALAREYGFASWRRLKAHVESLPRPVDSVATPAAAPSHSGGGGGGAVSAAGAAAPSYGFERYTPKARQALFFSRYEASELGSQSIQPEHVLLGLIHAGQGLRGRIFERVPLSLDDGRARVAAGVDVVEKLPTSAVIPFGPDTMQIFRYATEEADRLVHQPIGLAHVLLGLLRQEDSMAASILNERGMRLDTVREEIVPLLNEEPM